jgi:hypothetical protein
METTTVKYWKEGVLEYRPNDKGRLAFINDIELVQIKRVSMDSLIVLDQSGNLSRIDVGKAQRVDAYVNGHLLTPYFNHPILLEKQFSYGASVLFRTRNGKASLRHKASRSERSQTSDNGFWNMNVPAGFNYALGYCEDILD